MTLHPALPESFGLMASRTRQVLHAVHIPYVQRMANFVRQLPDGPSKAANLIFLHYYSYLPRATPPRKVLRVGFVGYGFPFRSAINATTLLGSRYGSRGLA